MYDVNRENWAIKKENQQANYITVILPHVKLADYKTRFNFYLG